MSTRTLRLAGTLLILVIAVPFARAEPARPTAIIVQWTFDDSTTAPAIGTGTATAGSGLADESFAAGNPGKAWSFTTWSNAERDENDYVEFTASTSGFSNIVFSFDERRSGAGVRTFDLWYSSDGATWAPFTTTAVPDDTSWRHHVFDLSDVLALNQQPWVAFRLYGYQAEADIGTWRLDNVTLSTGFSSTNTDLTIVKAGPATYTPGQGFVYIITVSNLTAVDAQNVVVSDTLPLDLSYGTDDRGAMLNGQLLTWNLGTLAGNSSTTINLNVNVAATASDPISNTATVGSSTPDSDSTNNHAISPPATSTSVGCADPPTTTIGQIQGSGATSPLEDTTVVVNGVVTGDFRGADRLSGLYIQAEEPDDDPATSDGIFVYVPNAPWNALAITKGDVVQVQGHVSEFNTITEIDQVTALVACGRRTYVPVHSITVPLTDHAALERYEGMVVAIDDPLIVSDATLLGRFGTLTLAADERLYQPTGDYNASTVDNDRRRLVLDDGRANTFSVAGPNPIPYLSADGTRRAGDWVEKLSGYIHVERINTDIQPQRDYVLHPATAPGFHTHNPRPVTPPAVGGTLKVASFNVLNYFTTLDSGNTDPPSARGADSAAEFERQRTKIISAIDGLDADIIGLIEIENNGDIADAGSAIRNLVDGLNAVAGPNTYAAIDDPATLAGRDQIKVALIYRPAHVTPVGSVISSADPIFDRPPVGQTFTFGTETFTVVVNHFKSKRCADATGADHDQGDGQGCYNARRRAQAGELLQLIATLQTSDPDVVVLGDFNAYASEDPIDDLIAGGLVNQIGRFVPRERRYSFVFDGMAGYIDHALATSGMSQQIAGAAFWHINADEPAVFDYNLDNGDLVSPQPKPDDRYTPAPYRSSDHDPVLIGLAPGATLSAADLHTSSKTVSATTVNVGDTLTYTFSIVNSGHTMTTFALTDTLDPAFGIIDAGPLTYANGTLTWHDSIAGGETRIYQLVGVVQSMPANPITNIAQLAGDGNIYTLPAPTVTVAQPAYRIYVPLVLNNE